MPTKPRDLNKPRIRKAGQDCWVATHPYYCKELGETMNTVTMFRTWCEAINYATQQENQ